MNNKKRERRHKKKNKKESNKEENLDTIANINLEDQWLQKMKKKKLIIGKNTAKQQLIIINRETKEILMILIKNNPECHVINKNTQSIAKTKDSQNQIKRNLPDDIQNKYLKKFLEFSKIIKLNKNIIFKKKLI